MMEIDIQKVLAYTKQLTVLYVEDNKDTREITGMLFSEVFGCVVEAIDGEDGLTKFNEQNFSLIISDINMPKMNGIEMVKKIRESNVSMPIIISSAYTKESMEEVEALNIQGYLTKPMELEKLFELILAIFQGEDERLLA